MTPRRVQRELPLRRFLRSPDDLKNNIVTPPNDVVRSDLRRSTNGRNWFDPQARSASVDVDVNLFFQSSCHRFTSWHSFNGFQCGWVFCTNPFDPFCCDPFNQLFWFWWRPGCAPCFVPYYVYYTPSSYYLPAYCPSYADVRVVHEYVDDGSYYPSLDGSQAVPTESADMLESRGWDEFRAGDYPAASESFRQAVLVAPTDPHAKVAFAQALFALGDYPDAAFLLRRAAELLPDWPVVGTDPRVRYGRPEDHAEQIVALHAFLERVPSDPTATLVLAVQSYFTGDLTVARESFERLRELDPEDQVARRFLERLGPAPQGH